MFSFQYFIMHNYIEYSWDLFFVTLLYLIKMLLLFSFLRQSLMYPWLSSGMLCSHS